jgi:hypothetical protein
MSYPIFIGAPTQRERRRRQSARLIAKVFEVDPLRCPCGATMQVIPAVIRKILQHRPRPEPRAHLRPAWWGVPPADLCGEEPAPLVAVTAGPWVPCAPLRWSEA